MRPYLPPPRRITEDQGSKGPPLPSSGGGSGLDDELPSGIVKKNQYADIGRQLIADAKRDAEAQAKEEAEHGSTSGFDPEPIRQLLAKHEATLRKYGGDEAVDIIAAAVGGNDETSVEESFFPKRPRMTEQRLRKFANSLR